jgi:hypothetical protein
MAAVRLTFYRDSVILLTSPIMERLLIELKHAKAYKLLENMQDLQLIEIIKQPLNVSELKNKIKGKMNNLQIDEQLSSMRNEWQRNT